MSYGFEHCGADRFGGNPALVREPAPKKRRTKTIPPTGLPPLQRKG